ncbi:putative neutral zinc metallopeptidase [Coprobacillus sp. CAG:605]|nr:putative neutral zinc metallopeptidase [Coprobacillus sp. CAG:605]
MDLILVIIVISIPLIAQIGVSSNYQKYKRVKNTKELTGYDVARKILDENGLEDIYIVETRGELTDHYDPTKKVVRLSSDIYHGKTVAAMSVASHECGHAIQDKDGYTFMRIRSAIFPIVNVATSISYWIILLGFLFELLDLIYIGIALTCLGLLFQIVTLPVEFDASKRAGVFLKEYNLATEDESKGVKKMLGAAAMTYVAGVLASALQILRLILVARNND